MRYYQGKHRHSYMKRFANKRIANMFFLLVFIIIFVLVVLIWMHRQYQYYLSVSQSPLSIETFDGSNSPYHPTVVYFKTSWNGYHYWMAETPYPIDAEPYKDRWECPSVHVSNDGFLWKSISPESFPLDDLTKFQILDYDFFSDPHLVFANGKLECWYRISERSGQSTYSNKSDRHTLLRRITKDGINWTEREEIFCITDEYKSELVSPSIIHVNGEYYMWVVNAKNDKDKHTVHFLSSVDAKHWDKFEECTFEGPQLAPWHIDVQYIDGCYWLVCYNVYGILTLWRSEDNTHFEYVKNLLSPAYSSIAFYSEQLYRACLCKVAVDDYRMYFSAADEKSTYIGLMKGSSFENMELVSVEKRRFHTFSYYLKDHLKKIYRGIFDKK